jgi:hypothetical protein
MKKTICILVGTLLIFSGAIVIADWDEGDGHKMHWPQLPDPNGYDVFCTAGLPQWPWIVLADDWECSESGYVKDIHFWGSWYNDIVGEIDHFVMGVANNIPGPPYSRPGDTLIEWEIHDWVERGPYNGNQGWYWAFEPGWIPDNHNMYWQYNVFLDESEWFWQEEGEIYWLFISAILKEEPEQPLWGWKSTYEDLQFMDDSVWAIWYELNWIPLTYPSGLSMDLAFVITGGEPCEPSIDVEKYVWDPDNADWIDADTAADALDLEICTDASFKIVIKNDGECTLVNIKVRDWMHDSLKYLSGDPDPDLYQYIPPDHYMAWEIPGPLEPGESKEIFITAHVEGPDCSRDYNRVEVEGYADPYPDPVTDQDEAWVHAIEKGRIIISPFLNWLQNHPNLFPILRMLLQRLAQ